MEMFSVTVQDVVPYLQKEVRQNGKMCGKMTAAAAGGIFLKG